MCCDVKSSSFILEPYLSCHSSEETATGAGREAAFGVWEYFLHNFLSYLRRQSRCQAIISPSHLKNSGLFPGTTVCWSAFELAWSAELCRVSLWKMTSLGFLFLLFRQDELSESGWDSPGFAVCVENLYGSIVTQLFVSSHAKAPCQELPCHHGQSDSKCQEYCVGCCSHFIHLSVLHCQVFCRNMGEHLAGVSFEHMEVEDRLLLIICVWK